MKTKTNQDLWNEFMSQREEIRKLRFMINLLINSGVEIERKVELLVESKE